MGKLRVFISSAHVQNIAKLLSANVVAQVIGLVVYPILSRIYAPEDFGLLNLFLSIGGVIAILATAELYNAIVLPKDDKEGVAVVHICFYLLLLVVGITTISIFFTDSIASLFKTTTLAKYYWAMPILVFALGMWNILNYWYIRVSSYDRISGYQLSSSLLSAGAKVSLGYLNILQGGMIYSVVFAPIVSLLVSVVLSWKKGIKQLFHSSQMDLRAVAKKYRNFPLYSLPKSLVFRSFFVLSFPVPVKPRVLPTYLNFPTCVNPAPSSRTPILFCSCIGTTFIMKTRKSTSLRSAS